MGDNKFILAAKDGYSDLLKEATKRDLNANDEDGMTAVHWAANKGHLEALRLIVGRGGDCTRCDYLGYTPLHHAANKGFLDVVSFLVNWGCNLFAMDNEGHTAMDLAYMYEREHVIRLLDSAVADQTQRNPRNVSKQKEQAVVSMERNRKRYQRKQEEAKRLAEKEDRRREIITNQQNGDFKPPGKTSFFKTLTLKIKGGGGNRVRQPVPGGRTYSHFVGQQPKSGAAKKVQQRKAASTGDFSISQLDGDGKRTVRSLSGEAGIRSASTSSEVLYRTANRVDGDPSSRPGLNGVFNNKTNLWKAKSETDLLGGGGDSGNDSYFSDHDEEDGDDADVKGGLFYRPGMGNIAFGQRTFLNTLPSFEVEELRNGQVGSDEADGEGEDEDGLPATNGQRGSPVRGTADVPWDESLVEVLDDDEEDSEFSSLEMFLVASGLQSCIPYFTRERVDLTLLLTLGDAELKDLGLQFGPRRKLLEALQRRQASVAAPGPITDSYL